MKTAFLALFGFTALFALSTLFGSFYTISQGERGVVTRFGAVTGVADPGLGFKAPFITGITAINVQTQVLKLDKEEAYSQDQQPAVLQLSVNYSVVPGEVKAVYSDYGNRDNLESRLIKPRIRQQLKNIFGHYNASTAISARDKLNSEVRAAIQESVKGPVEIEGVQIEDIKFSPAYEEAIEARMTAEVEVSKSMQKASNEKQLAQITVTKAQAQADSELAVATAKAKAVTLNGEAEATAIRAKGAALKDNPSLIEYQAIGQGWNGVLPVTMLPGSVLPFVGVK